MIGLGSDKNVYLSGPELLALGTTGLPGDRLLGVNLLNIESILLILQATQPNTITQLLTLHIVCRLLERLFETDKFGG